MAALTRLEMQTRLAKKLANRSDLDTQIQDALTDAQDELELDPKLLPWFLEKDSDAEGTNVVTVADTATITPPTGFLVEAEEGGLFRYDASSTPSWKNLKKDDFDSLLAAKTGTGEPTHYALVGTKVYLFPIPDAVYTIRFVAVFQDDVLSADGTSNLWSTYASKLLMSRAGLSVAEDMGMERHKGEFLTQHTNSYKNFKDLCIAKKVAATLNTAGD